MEVVDFTTHVEETVEATTQILRNAFEVANSSLEEGGYHYGIPRAAEMEIEKQFKRLLTDQLEQKVAELAQRVQGGYLNA